MSERAARDLHPGAWWIWALGLAVAASATTNPWLLLLLVAAAALVVVARRSDHTWSLSFRLYLVLALFIVVLRLVFRIVLGTGSGHVLIDLPEIGLPGWVHGVRLLGPLTRESLLSGLYDGMRLATLVVCVGAANALANPKRLLRAMPPALYEIGTAVVVAVSVLPQLADSVQRVRAARRLRGVPGGRVRALRGLVIPVLEDALERSLALAAGMDARGYGRTGSLGRGRRAVTGALLLLGLVGVCVGVYAVLDHTAPRWLALPMLGGGLLLAGGGFVSAGGRVGRTRYRPDRWQAPDVAVALSGVLVAVGITTMLPTLVLLPDVTGAPPLTALALLLPLVGALPALVAPPPMLTAAAVTGSPAGGAA
ncbi:MAG: energy-coupling factor transporter transmembrane component T family protein [Marmoricola sp.]